MRSGRSSAAATNSTSATTSATTKASGSKRSSLPRSPARQSATKASPSSAWPNTIWMAGPRRIWSTPQTCARSASADAREVVGPPLYRVEMKQLARGFEEIAEHRQRLAFAPRDLHLEFGVVLVGRFHREDVQR